MNDSIFDIQNMRTLPPAQRPCIHHIKGRITFKTCTNRYLCGNCEFDQYFYDEYTVHAMVTPVLQSEVRGFKVPQGYYLHNGHAWARIEEGSSVRIGIDDFALKVLGPLDRLEAPLIGKLLRQGKPHIEAYRGERKARFLSPLSGVVTAVNPKFREGGGLSEKDPYSDGWVMTLHPQDLRKEIKNLMIAQQSVDFLEKETDRLYEMIEGIFPLAADGGCLGKDLFGAMPQLGWKRLTRIFLRA